MNSIDEIIAAALEAAPALRERVDHIAAQLNVTTYAAIDPEPAEGSE